MIALPWIVWLLLVLFALEGASRYVVTGYRVLVRLGDRRRARRAWRARTDRAAVQSEEGPWY